MKNNSKDVVRYVIHLLSEQRNVSKIVVQKVVYFLIEFGIPLDYSYEPQTYGPFSRQLARELDDMVFWEDIKQTGNYYSVTSEQSINLSLELKRSVDIKMTLFNKIVGNNYSFQTMEVIGTILYCITALKRIDATLTFEKVFEEFRAWKGDKYTKDFVQTLYNNLMNEWPLPSN